MLRAQLGSSFYYIIVVIVKIVVIIVVIVDVAMLKIIGVRSRCGGG